MKDAYFTGFTYTYYQLRGSYKNWFSQVYLNQSNSGDTRGYNQGNVIRDESRNIAAQIQNNFIRELFTCYKL